MNKTPSPESVAMSMEKLRMRLGGVLCSRGTRRLKERWEGEWRKNIQQIEYDNKHRPEVVISLVGGTGSGKSTLINAVIEARILPVSSMTACTAAVSEVAFSPDDCYQASIEFISHNEWRQEVEVLAQDLADQEREQPDESDSNDYVRRPLNSSSARDKLRAIYGLEENEIEWHRLQSLREPLEIQQALSQGHAAITCNGLTEFSHELGRYLSAKEHFWPIVKAVRIRGHFEALKSGVKLVDLPGVNDPNAAREKVTHDYIKNSRFVWMVFNIKRAITKDIHGIMQSDDFLRQVVMDGREHSLTLVGTASDEIDTDTAWREFGLEEDATETQIVLARNNAAKKKVREQLIDLAHHFANRLGDGQHADKLALALGKSQIFTVSALEYLKFKGLGRGKPKILEAPEHTEVPLLRDHMESMCENYGVEAHSRSLHRRIDIILDDIDRTMIQEKASLHHQREMTASRRKEVADAITRLRDFLTRDLHDHQERFAQDLNASRELLNERIGRAIDRGRSDLSHTCNSWSRIHWATLRAVCRRGGTFQSPTSGYHDLPGEIAKPVLDGITFAWSDFFGDKLSNAMETWTERLLVLAERHRNDIQSQLASYKTDATDALRQDLENAMAVTDKLLHELLSQTRSEVSQKVDEQRRTLYETIPNQIRADMRAAFLRAADESGTGMKQRIVDALTRHAQQISATMFEDAQKALSDGVGSLTDWLCHQYAHMAKQVDHLTSSPVKNVLTVEQMPEEEVKELLDGLAAIRRELDSCRSIEPALAQLAKGRLRGGEA